MHPEEFPEARFHPLADRALHSLLDAFEAFLEDSDDPSLDAADIEFSEGVLTAKLGSKGTYVFNKQVRRRTYVMMPLS